MTRAIKGTRSVRTRTTSDALTVAMTGRPTRFTMRTSTPRPRPAIAATESHLESERAQTVRIDGLALDVSFRAGEKIYTESSYKYSFTEIERLARAAGLVVEERWLDSARRFSVNLLAPMSG